jgi:hypothetical protein
MNKRHGFDIETAQEYGLIEAILIENFVFWIEKNRANNKHFKEDHYWTYNTVRAFMELFPYLSRHQIMGAINNLTEKGVLIKGAFSGYDRTLWYAFADEEKWLGKRPAIVQKTEMDCLKNGNPLSKKRKCITDTIPDKETDKESAPSETPSPELLNLTEEENKTVKEKKKNDGPDFIDQVLEIFKEVYKESRGLPYYIPNKDKERRIIGKILAEWKKTHAGKNSEQTLSGMRELFTFAAGIKKDKWIYENFSLSIVNSAINKIRALYKEEAAKRPVPLEEKKELTLSEKIVMQRRQEAYGNGH